MGLTTAFFVLCFLPHLQAQTSTGPLSYTIAADELNNQWEDWSWNTVSRFNQPTPDGESGTSIHYMAAGAGLYLHAKTPISLTGLKAIKIWVRGGSSVQKVQAFINNTEPVFSFSTAVEQWVLVSIPLRFFGSPASLSDFYLQTEAPDASPVWYVKSIILEGAETPDWPATDVLVTPNPVEVRQSKVVLKFINFVVNEPVQLTLTDTYGRMLRQRILSLSNVEESISVEGLATGQYFINVSGLRGRHVRKIIIK